MILLVASCGGGANNPTAPSSPRASSVSVVLENPLTVGGTSQATATATLSSGDAQPVTTGFRSDTPSVATVTDGGLVTGIANGLANIFVVSGGAQGTVNLRVVPSYQGQWRGSYSVEFCNASGVLEDLCDSLFSVNRVLPVSMSISQNSIGIAGTFFFGTVAFDPFTAQIEGDGSASFSAGSVDNSLITSTATWRISSPQQGRLTGRVTMRFRPSEDVPGSAEVRAEIVDWLNKIDARSAGPLVAPGARSFGEAIATP